MLVCVSHNKMLSLVRDVHLFFHCCHASLRRGEPPPRSGTRTSTTIRGMVRKKEKKRERRHPLQSEKAKGRGYKQDAHRHTRGCVRRKKKKNCPPSSALFSILFSSLVLVSVSYASSLANMSLPLSSTMMKAGKSTTSIFHTASMPHSGKAMHSTFLISSLARMAAGPPMLPR